MGRFELPKRPDEKIKTYKGRITLRLPDDLITAFSIAKSKTDLPSNELIIEMIKHCLKELDQANSGTHIR